MNEKNKNQEERERVAKNKKKGCPCYFPHIQIEPERFLTFTVVKSS